MAKVRKINKTKISALQAIVVKANTKGALEFINAKPNPEFRSEVFKVSEQFRADQERLWRKEAIGESEETDYMLRRYYLNSNQKPNIPNNKSTNRLAYTLKELEDYTSDNEEEKVEGDKLEKCPML